jgi:hypothetical protein
MFVNLVMEMAAQNITKHYAIFFCVKLGGNVTTTHGKLQQAFGDDAVSRAQTFCWHKMFSEGRTLIKDEQCSGQPLATRRGDNTAWVRDLYSLIKD